MAYTTPSLVQFRERFPEFADVTDSAVNIAIGDAVRFAIKDGDEMDYQVAVLFLAAHFVYLGKIAAADEESALTSRVRSISYGPQTVTFGPQDSAVDGSGMTPDGESVYFTRYKMLIPDPLLPIVLLDPLLGNF